MRSHNNKHNQFQRTIKKQAHIVTSAAAVLSGIFGPIAGGKAQALGAGVWKRRIKPCRDRSEYFGGLCLQMSVTGNVCSAGPGPIGFCTILKVSNDSQLQQSSAINLASGFLVLAITILGLNSHGERWGLVPSSGF